MIWAVVVAGGSGSRMGAPVRKQYLDLDGMPIVSHTLAAIDRCPGLKGIVLVVPDGDQAFCRRDVLAPLTLDHDVRVVAGGRHRQESVLNGLNAVVRQAGIVLIHDAVRPFVRPWLMQACLEGVRATGACIPVISVSDTLKQVDEKGTITGTLDRRLVRLAQTPQVFSNGLIRRAHRLAARRGFPATDDASIAEFAGERVVTVSGDCENIKITTPHDLTIARAIHGNRKRAALRKGRQA